MGRAFIKTSGRHSASNPYCWHGGAFYKWRVYLNEGGWVKVEFTFDDSRDWDRLVEDMMKELARQKKKFPDKWKEQKSQCVRSVNFTKRNDAIRAKRSFDNFQILQMEKVKEWTDFVLPLARKRK
jgi:hypothetical protein